jgi:hypothetical protein
MHVLRSGVVRLGAVLLLAVAVMAAAYGFAATNTVPDTRAGDGARNISGYTVCHVQYALDGSNPQNLSKVEFTLYDTGATCPASPSGSPAPASAVRVKLQQSGGTWYSCNNSDSDNDGRDWECSTSTPSQSVKDADELRVVAVQ